VPVEPVTEPVSTIDAPCDSRGLVSYFSSLSGRSFPLLFQRGGEEVEVDTAGHWAVNESTAHAGALIAGLGIGQNFRFALQRHLDSGELVPVLPDWSQPRFPMYVMYPPNRHLNGKARVFVDWAVELFAAYDARPALDVY
jgi:DNA-binding transcriptional LysR family regulator